jgi:hypothetical protein
MAVKRRKKRTTKSSSPSLPSALRMTKKKKQKLNRIVLFAMFILGVNLYVTFFYEENIGDMIKDTATWVKPASQAQEMPIDAGNIHDVDLDDRRAVIITQTAGRNIPSQFGKTLKNLADGTEVIIIKNEGKWLQVRDEYGVIMWVDGANIMKN